MQLDIKVVNRVLQEARNLTIGYTDESFYGLNSEWEFIEGQKDSQWGREEQGEEGKYTCIFKIKYLPDIFVRVTFFSDSYGEPIGDKNQIQFVKEQLKQVLIYEPI